MKAVRQVSPIHGLGLWVNKMFNQKRVQSFHVAMVVASVIIVSASAAPVEIYSSPAWVTGDGSTQVETIGFLKYAYSAGFNVVYGGTIDLPGKEGKVVTFKTTSTAHGTTTNALGTDIEFSPKVTRAARDGSYQPVVAITGNYRTALRDIYYVNVTPFSYTNTLKNLTAGRTYLIQIWASDGASASAREVKYSLSVGSYTNSFQLDINNGDVIKKEGQVATFKATAESSTMTLVLEAAGTAANFACFSAIQVRDITPMFWSTASGDWNTTGTNWDPAEDGETVWGSTTGIDRHAEPSGRGGQDIDCGHGNDRSDNGPSSFKCRHRSRCREHQERLPGCLGNKCGRQCECLDHGRRTGFSWRYPVS